MGSNISSSLYDTHNKEWESCNYRIVLRINDNDNQQTGKIWDRGRGGDKVSSKNAFESFHFVHIKL